MELKVKPDHENKVKYCKFNKIEICTALNECLLSCSLNPGLNKSIKI